MTQTRTPTQKESESGRVAARRKGNKSGSSGLLFGRKRDEEAM
jgi:hypothetical protein